MNFHSEALWREIKVHVDMGMTPQRAIAAATRVNAQIIGKGRELGTIEPGKLADIIVVNGNPLFDIVALSHVEIVVKDGTVFKGANAAAAKPSTSGGRSEGAAALLGLLVIASLAGAQPPTPAQDLAHPQNTNAGIYAFTGRCAGCHDTGKDGATDRYALNRHTPEEVLASITTGSMAQYAQGLTEFEKRVVAVYVGGRPLGAAATGDASQMKNRCESHPPFEPCPGVRRGTAGASTAATRAFRPSPGLTAADAPKLTLKWAFGFPNGNSAYGQPTVAGGRVFVGADTGFVYALDAATGCIHWSFRADAGVRTAVSIGKGNAAHRYLAYFGDVKGERLRGRRRNRRAGLDAIASTRIRSRASPARRRWSTAGSTCRCPRSRNRARATRAIRAARFAAASSSYDAATGKRLWTSYTIPEQAGAAEEDLEGHAALGTGRRRRLVVADRSI